MVAGCLYEWKTVLGEYFSRNKDWVMNIIFLPGWISLNLELRILIGSFFLWDISITYYSMKYMPRARSSVNFGEFRQRPAALSHQNGRLLRKLAAGHRMASRGETIWSCGSGSGHTLIPRWSKALRTQFSLNSYWHFLFLSTHLCPVHAFSSLTEMLEQKSPASQK
jgi:hypothetical protein